MCGDEIVMAAFFLEPIDPQLLPTFDREWTTICPVHSILGASGKI